jgi:hypothetical protein
MGYFHHRASFPANREICASTLLLELATNVSFAHHSLVIFASLFAIAPGFSPVATRHRFLIE